MSICENYENCEGYQPNSQACNENSIATGYCGIRKNLEKDEKSKTNKDLVDIILLESLLPSSFI